MLRLLAILAAATLGLGAATGFAATLGVGSWKLWAGSQTLTRGTCTVTGSASITDTFVSEAQPSRSFGGSTVARTSPSTGARDWAFYRFDLGGCAIPATGGADTATLQLVLSAPPRAGRTLTVTPVLSPWSGTLTWNQAQSLAYGAPTTTFATGTSAGTLSIPVTVDVDALIRNPSASFGWRISDDGAPAPRANAAFATVQAGASVRPQLVVSYVR